MNGLTEQVVRAIKAGASVTFRRYHRDCITVEVSTDDGMRHAMCVESQYIVESAYTDVLCHSLAMILERTSITDPSIKED